MAFPVWIDNLIAYSLQMAILASAGTLLAYLFRLRLPRVTLLYWQSLLMACLFIFALQEWRHPVSVSVTAGSTVISEPLAAAAVPMPAAKPVRFRPEWIAWILSAGALLRFIWLGLGLLRLRMFRRNARRQGEKTAVIEEMQLRTGVRATVLFSDEIDTPVTFGIRNAAVILPARFNEMNEDCRSAVLCHELLHIRRRDWLFIMVEEVIRSVFWFHPAIWWLLGRIRLSREQAVDCEVVQQAGKRQPYLDSLLEFARAQGRPRAVPAPLFLKERHLVQRVALLLKEASMSRSRLFISLAGISVLLIVTVRFAAGWFPLTGEPVIMPLQVSMDTQSAVVPDAVAKLEPANNAPSVAPQKSAAAAKAKKVMIAENIVPSMPAEPAAPAQQSAPPFRDPIRVGGNVQESKIIYKVEPVYPEEAKRARINGAVVLLVTANEEGLVTDVKVNNGHPMLVDAAVAAVKQWRYSPTLLNGVPVPVIFTVTCIFNFMGENDVSVAMDAAGNLSVAGQSFNLDMVMPKLAQGGTAYVRVPAGTPMPVAEGVLQDLQRRGVQRIQLTGPFHLYQGRLFYAGAPASPPRLMPDIEKLLALLKVSPEQSDPATGKRLIYAIYVSEVGEILGVQRTAGPDIPEIDEELMRTRVLSPAMLGANPVRFVYPFMMVCRDAECRAYN